MIACTSAGRALITPSFTVPSAFLAILAYASTTLGSHISIALSDIVFRILLNAVSKSAPLLALASVVFLIASI
jgi:hypothetical protein